MRPKLTFFAEFSSESSCASALPVHAFSVAVAISWFALVVAQLALEALPSRVAAALAVLVVPVAGAEHLANTWKRDGVRFRGLLDYNNSVGREFVNCRFPILWRLTFQSGLLKYSSTMGLKARPLSWFEHAFICATISFSFVISRYFFPRHRRYYISARLAKKEAKKPMIDHCSVEEKAP